MKDVFIIQHSNLSFDMNIAKIYNPKKYNLFLIIDSFCFEKLKARKQENLFEKVWCIEDFSFSRLKRIIEDYICCKNVNLKIVTNSEETVQVCGDLRVYFNIDKKNYDRFKDKLLMKKLVQEYGLMVPRHRVFDRNVYLKDRDNYLTYITMQLKFPVIIKPTNLQSCSGVFKANTIEELKFAVDNLLDDKSTYEIDEFISGKVYNCDSFLQEGNILFSKISECSNSCYDFICGLTKGTIELLKESYLYEILYDYTEKIHKALLPPDAGVTHLEVVLNDDGNFYFLEIAHRAPGVLIPAMYKKRSNIDIIETHIILQIDEAYIFDTYVGPYSAWVAFPKKSGVIKKQYAPKIHSEYALEWAVAPDECMMPASCGRDYAGKVLLWNNDYQKLYDDFYTLTNFKFFDVY